MITCEIAEELTQGLGQVFGGSYRIVASAIRIGIPEALGLTTEQWVQERLGGYVKMSAMERRDAVRELISPEEEGGAGLSPSQAAEAVGVDRSTVYDDLRGGRPVVNPTHEEENPQSRRTKPVGNPTGLPINFLDVAETIQQIKEDIGFLYDRKNEITRPGDVAASLEQVLVQLQGLIEVLRDPSTGQAPDWLPDL